MFTKRHAFKAPQLKREPLIAATRLVWPCREGHQDGHADHLHQRRARHRSGGGTRTVADRIVLLGPDDRTRSFTGRVKHAFGSKVPNPEQAGAYSGVLHYLKAVALIGGPQAKQSGRAVVDAMKKLPTDDDVFGPGRVREDGQKLHPAYLFEVKSPAESTRDWDFYKLRATTPTEEAFRPMNIGGCPLVAKG